MLKYWIGQEFLIELVLDLGNYSLLCLIFFFFYKKKIFNLNLFFILCVFMATPFLFNNLYIDWRLSPDQSKYLGITNMLRDNFGIYEFDRDSRKVLISSYIFSISPLISIDTFKSVGFLNRFFLLATTVYLFKKKKIDFSLFLLVLLTPSLTYFSSIFLRETLILVAMIWATYFFLEKKYLILLPFLIILFFIKIQNLAILLIFFYIYIIYKYIHSVKFLVLNLLLILVITSLYGDFFVQEINSKRQGMYFEEYGGYKGISALNAYENISFDLNLIVISLKSFFMFVMSPIFTNTNWFKVLFIIESVFLYAFFIRYFYIDKQIEINNVIIFWSLVLIISFIFYSLVVFNDGTILRYRVQLIFFALFGYNLHKHKILENKQHAK